MNTTITLTQHERLILTMALGRLVDQCTTSDIRDTVEAIFTKLDNAIRKDSDVHFKQN